MHWLGGVLDHAPALSALCAPTVNCSKRYKDWSFAPSNVTWGIQNRSCAVRAKVCSCLLFVVLSGFVVCCFVVRCSLFIHSHVLFVLLCVVGRWPRRDLLREQARLRRREPLPYPRRHRCWYVCMSCVVCVRCAFQ